MHDRAMAMARCDLPVPVPPTRTALRCSARNAPVARLRTRLSLIGVSAKGKPSRSLASGSLAMVIWYLIERACFSAISAASSSPMMRAGACWRLIAVAITSGLPRDWGSGCGGDFGERVVCGEEALPEAGAERAVVDGAADLEQPIGTAPRPAHLLRFVHAAIDEEVGRSLGQRRANPQPG